MSYTFAVRHLCVACSAEFELVEYGMQGLAAHNEVSRQGARFLSPNGVLYWRGLIAVGCREGLVHWTAQFGPLAVRLAGYIPTTCLEHTSQVAY